MWTKTNNRRRSRKLGGRKTASTHGREFYKEIGHKSGQKVSVL